MTRILLSLSLVLAAAASGCITSPSPLAISPLAVSSGEMLIVDHALLVIDGSGSIDRQQFAEEKVLVEAFVGGMPQGSYSAGGIAFGGDERQVFPQRSFDRALLRANTTEVKHFGKGTPLDAVIDEAKAALASRTGRVALILFSDGLPTDPRQGEPLNAERVVSAARALVDSRGGEVCIHTIQIGAETEGAALLARLAELTSCGTARPASSIESVSSLEGFERQVFLGGLPGVGALGADRDGDGVADQHDACPRTPRGATVDSRGCWVIGGPHFATDSSSIKDMYRLRLDEAVKVLSQNPELRIQIDGHTDNRGSHEYNQALSERRAESVRSYLVERGIGESRFEVRGWSFDRPLQPNDSPENLYQNRRSELTVLP